MPRTFRPPYLVLLALCLWLGCKSDPRTTYPAQFAEAERFIRKIESFDAEYGHLPTRENTYQLGGRYLHYVRFEDGYEVGFLVDGKVVHRYDSRLGKWDFER